jgi:hypothetical protein
MHNIDEGSCTDLEKKVCTGSSGCRKIDGIAECFCTDGFELDETKIICKGKLITPLLTFSNFCTSVKNLQI